MELRRNGRKVKNEMLPVLLATSPSSPFPEWYQRGAQPYTWPLTSKAQSRVIAGAQKWKTEEVCPERVGAGGF